MIFTLQLGTKLSLNKIYGGVHWSTRQQHKHEYHDIVWAEQLPQYTGAFPVQITYTFRFKGRRLDTLNTAYMAKLIEDGLVNEEVIPDDAPKYVKRSVLEVEAGDNEVEISIEPL